MATHTPLRWLTRDRLLGLAAASLVVGAVWAGPTGGGVGGFATVVAVLPLLASVGGVRGSSVGLALLWGSLGMLTGLALLTIFGVGLVYLGAALFLPVAIAQTPNRTDSSRLALPYLVAELVGFLIVLAPLAVM